MTKERDQTYLDSLSSADLMFRLAEMRPEKYRDILIETGDDLVVFDLSAEFSECPACGWTFPANEIAALSREHDCPKCENASTKNFRARAN